MRVVGVSFDAPAKNAKFKDVESFQFDLWSDTQRELALWYGAAKSKSQFFANRITVVLDPAGTWTLLYPEASIAFHEYDHAKVVLADLKALMGK